MRPLVPELGVLLADHRIPRLARETDPVDRIVFRGSLIDPPRAAAGRAIGERFSVLHPQAKRATYVWQVCTHPPADRVASTRKGIDGGTGLLAEGPAFDHGLKASRTAARALGADTLVLNTPPSFSPSAVHRRALVQFAERVQSAVAWQASGLWEAEEVRRICTDLGWTAVERAFTATGRPASFGDGSWIVVEGHDRLGGRAELLVDATDDSDCLILFEGRFAYGNLRAVSREF